MHCTDMLMYILAQCAGSFAGAGLIMLFCPAKYQQSLLSANAAKLGQPQVATDMNVEAFILKLWVLLFSLLWYLRLPSTKE